MKNTQHRTNIVLAAIALVLSACGGYDRSAQVTSFQKQSKMLVGSIAGSISEAKYGVRAVGLRGTTGGNYSNICLPGYTANCGGGNTGGGITSPISFAPSSHDELVACQTSLNQMQQTAQNYLPAMAVYAQCLDRILVQSNQQLFTLAFAHMDPQTQQLFQFMLNSRGVSNNQGTDPMLLQFLFGMNGNNFMNQ